MKENKKAGLGVKRRGSRRGKPSKKGQVHRGQSLATNRERCTNLG
jgi:hypothetical protein